LNNLFMKAIIIIPAVLLVMFIGMTGYVIGLGQRIEKQVNQFKKGQIKPNVLECYVKKLAILKALKTISTNYLRMQKKRI
ncbi:MAG: hypothetical protein AABY22_19690, partial [Nanoarchaeota archaeon]